MTIPIPNGVRVWLATGHTDMRKGFASLSLQVQEVLRRDPLSGHLFCFRGRRGDLLKVIGMTARAHACSRRDWNGVDSCGRARPTAPCRSRRRSSDTFCPASIGVIPRQPGVRPRLDEGSGLQTAVGMIPLPGDRCRRIASRRPCRCSCDDPRRAGGADRGTSRARAGSCGGGQRNGRSDEHGSAHRDRKSVV